MKDHNSILTLAEDRVDVRIKKSRKVYVPNGIAIGWISDFDFYLFLPQTILLFTHFLRFRSYLQIESIKNEILKHSLSNFFY